MVAPAQERFPDPGTRNRGHCPGDPMGLARGLAHRTVTKTVEDHAANRSGRGIVPGSNAVPGRDPPAGSAQSQYLSLIHISEPTRLGMISYAVFCLKKKKKHMNT